MASILLMVEMILNKNKNKNKNMQREHVHYDPAQTYSPVMLYDSFRMILSIGAAQNWEIRSADTEEGQIKRIYSELNSSLRHST